MSSTSTAKTVMATIMALLIVSGAAAVMLGIENEATISGDYGQVYEIDLAPGFSYTYTPTCPSDLDVTTTIHQYESAGLSASMNGNTVSSTAISQTGSDLGVTWAVTSGTLQSGFTLDSSTGVVSGSSTALGNTAVTGTASNGPAQSATKNIAIKTEPKITVSSGSSTVATYPDASAQTLQMTSTSGTSAVTWSVSSATGVSRIRGWYRSE